MQRNFFYYQAPFPVENLRINLISVFPKDHVSSIYFHTNAINVICSDHCSLSERAYPATIYFENYYSYQAALNVFSNDLNLRGAWDSKVLELLITQSLVTRLMNRESFLQIQASIMTQIKRLYLSQNTGSNKIRKV